MQPRGTLRRRKRQVFAVVRLSSLASSHANNRVRDDRASEGLSSSFNAHMARSPFHDIRFWRHAKVFR